MTACAGACAVGTPRRLRIVNSSGAISGLVLLCQPGKVNARQHDLTVVRRLIETENVTVRRHRQVGIGRKRRFQYPRHRPGAAFVMAQADGQVRPLRRVAKRLR